MISLTRATEAHLRRRQQNFIAAVTHELKSPIASLQLAAETIALRRPGPARLDALVKRMRGDIRRLEDMVGRILDTATLEAGRPHLRQERLPLARLVTAVAEEFSERAAERGVKFTHNVPVGLEISADPAAANTVLRNLVENALQHTRPNTIVEVAVSETPAVTVTDRGPGVPAADRERLFQRFWRGRRDGSGAGLGLAIVARIVAAHGGRIEVDDAPGGGARFTLRLRSASAVG